MDPRLRALNRFGLGARIGERQAIVDPKGWLRSQLRGDAKLAGQSPSRSEIGAALRAYRTAGQSAERERQEARRRIVGITQAEMRGTLLARVTSTRPFVERLVAFWSNHLCVSSAAKLPVAALAGSYEREVIRPHVLGKLEDMVLASAQHPAMLIYLDNFQSIGPNSRGARAARARQRRGLNENYARELLELHTLGVDGGYTQQDVTELARLLTGWTLEGFGGRADAGDLAFRFMPQLHEPGAKQVVGVRYGEGVAEGVKAIRALCRHPSTAQFVARKLVAHFVSDSPPKTAVDRVAKVFAETSGDLAKVAEALIDLPEAWDEGGETKKFRTPQDWIVATLRAFNAQEVTDQTIPLLRQLRHPLWAPASPKGFGDARQEWADPDSLMNRAELARTMARRVVRQARQLDPRLLLDVADVGADDPLRGMLGDATISAEERVALALAGPAFQWR